MVEKYGRKSARIKHFQTYTARPYDLEKGKANEDRAGYLLRLLVEEGFYLRAGKASKKQNKEGIDYVAYTEDETRIPLQIKSSFGLARSFETKFGREIIPIVVNDGRTDAEILLVIRRQTELYRKGHQPRNPGR